MGTKIFDDTKPMEILGSKHTFESNLRFSVILTRGNFAEPVRQDDRINQRVPQGVYMRGYLYIQTHVSVTMNPWHNRCVFTAEQISEQKQFIRDLENNNADIVFEGTFEEGLSFLKDTGDLVDAINHS